MAQLRSQLEAVVMERDLARTFNGKISPVTTHATRSLVSNWVIKTWNDEFEHTRTPRACEEENVDTHERDESLLGGQIIDAGSGTGNSNDKLAHCHTDSTEEEKIATTPFLNHVKARQSGCNVDARRNQTDGEAVRDTRVLEEGSTVVEDEVDTSKLLERLQQTTSRKTLSEGALEAVGIGGLSERELILVVGNDLTKFFNDSWVVNGKTTETGKGAGGFFWLALLDQEARSLWQNEHTEDQDESPSELNRDRDSIRSAVIAVLGRIVNDRGQ